MSKSPANYPEGWLMDPNKYWSIRFHKDKKSWARFPFVFMDKGRAMSDGSPALLKSRKHLPKCDAAELCKQLKADGWNTVEPQWGSELEP